MTTTADQTAQRRKPLSRNRVLIAAVHLADSDGIEAVTMRRLGTELGVEAMSLYNHVANKNDLLDGVVDLIVDDINTRVALASPPTGPDDWKRAMRDRILAARSVMLDHKWAPSVIETRASLSPAIIGYFDGLLGVFRTGGFSYDLAHHALHALGSRAIGFTQELFEESGSDDTMTSEQLKQMVTSFPNIGEMLEVVSHDGPDDTVGWCDDQTEFIFGLDLLLDGLDRARLAES